MKIKQEKIWTITMILVNIFVFFGYLVPSRSAFLLVIAGTSLILYLFLNRRIKTEVFRRNILWLAILIDLFFSLLFTINVSLSIKFIMTYGATLIMKLIYDSLELDNPDFKWKEKFLNIAFVCSGIHVITTLIYNLYPDIILKLNRTILTTQQYSYNLLQYTQGLNPGICDDYGFNAFCVLMFVGIILSKIFAKEKIKILDVILLIFGIITLIIIGKRGHLLCFAIGTVICFWLSFNKIPIYKKFTIIIGSILIVLAVYYVATKIPATAILITRLKQTQISGGALNGREIIYQHSIETFKDNFLFGIGIRGIYAKYLGDGHNIYLQILAELGIFGATIVFITFIRNIQKAIIEYLKKENKSNKYLIMFSIFCQIFFLVNGITENTFYVESILIFYMIITVFNNFGIKKEKQNG